jgi:single-strand DNA-binding protein
MAGLNKIMIIGNLGTDPEMRYTPSGAAVTSFSVAVNRNYSTAGGERREETEWFRVNAWDRLAENANQYLAKGRQVYVEGRLSSRTWTGQDGQPRFTNEIRAFEIQFLGSQSDARDDTEGPPGPGEDDLPW